jgi:hypothetical protein
MKEKTLIPVQHFHRMSQNVSAIAIFILKAYLQAMIYSILVVCAHVVCQES